ncbi:hypothetical protein GCM10011612_14000 [Actinomyces gaoshouyii]|uniref:Uncharacterized protein n=1 Tax=Actinomyces gaoshouyii TaxID=1960083 RepID=A0A8H9H926_9ACTO|nr:hypothetical protein GCM10011612_14000 [Actinomyces gaoshouyii]
MWQLRSEGFGWVATAVLIDHAGQPSSAAQEVCPVAAESARAHRYPDARAGLLRRGDLGEDVELTCTPGRLLAQD